MVRRPHVRHHRAPAFLSLPAESTVYQQRLLHMQQFPLQAFETAAVQFRELRDKLEPFDSEDELSASMHLQPLTSTGSRDACSRCPILSSDTPATGCKSCRERRAGTIR